ncbi:MAG: hypothetical protein ABJC12_12030 [Saprospiraceae bacterium]
MKKFIFSIFLFSLMVFSANAQKAACCKPGGKNSAGCQAMAPSAVSVENAAAAQKVAAMDQTIETRTDPITGNVSYFRKESASADGNATLVSVSFDPVANVFVNVPPSMMEEANATSTSPGTTKACCSKGAGKSCCSGKATAAKPEKTKS